MRAYLSIFGGSLDVSSHIIAEYAVNLERRHINLSDDSTYQPVSSCYCSRCFVLNDENSPSLNVIVDITESKTAILGKLLFYGVLFALNLFILFCYILFQSLPEDNVLGIPSAVQYISEHCISLIIAINSSLIIPNFTHYFLTLFGYSVKEHSNKFILVIRTMTTIIIPITLSFYLLDDCGRGWTNLWKPCDDPMFLEDSVYDYYHKKTAILHHDDVCSVSSVTEMDLNKCIRSFLRQWCDVLLLKMFIMMFMPIFIIFKKTVWDWKIRGKQSEIVIDSEYTMLTTKLEVILVFGVFSPLLYPIIIAAMNSFIFFYEFSTRTLRWNIRFENHEHGLQSFPFHFLVFGILCEQMLSFLFMKTSDEYRGWGEMNDVISWTLLALYIVIDVVALWMYYVKRGNSDRST